MSHNEHVHLSPGSKSSETDGIKTSTPTKEPQQSTSTYQGTPRPNQPLYPQIPHASSSLSLATVKTETPSAPPPYDTLSTGSAQLSFGIPDFSSIEVDDTQLSDHLDETVLEVVDEEVSPSKRGLLADLGSKFVNRIKLFSHGSPVV